MKDWMLALPIALFTLSSTVYAEVNTDPKVLSDQLFRTGLAFCNEASKKSRTDTQLARADFANYESHLERAKAIYPQLMDENDFASREATRCELVDDNIARAEAMPLIEQGLAYCNEAKTRLEASSGVFEAETNLKQYKELRDQALETTPTILRVGSVAVQVRVCDGLDEKISLVENQMKRTHRETDKVIASFNKAMDTCQVGTGMLKGATSNPETVEAAGEGISVKPLLAYENEHIRICRPKSLSAKDAQQIVRFAVNRIGSHQGGNNLLDLIRFFFPWGLLPFSWRKPTFLHWAGRNTRNTTAAFVAESFGFIQFPLYPLVKTSSDHGVQLLRRHPKLCLPFEFDLSPSFEIIKYPFIDFQVYENERLIPWKGSGDFSGMEQDTALVYQSGVKKLNSDGEAADGTGAGPGENNEQDDPKVTSINSRPE